LVTLKQLAPGGRFQSLAWPLLVGLALRALWAVLVPVKPMADGNMYWTFAQSIANGLGYAYPDGALTAYWPVGTSAFYALGFHVFGASFTVAVVFNLGIFVLSIWALHRLALILGLSRGQAAAAAWLFALWPLGIQYTTILASEMLFNALILSSLVVWAWAPTGRPWWRVALFAVLMVAATYVRPTAMPLLLAIPAAAILQHARWGLALKEVAISLLVAVVLISPWAIRNKAAVSDYVPVSANFGINLWMGNNPTTDGGFRDFLPGLKFDNEVQRDQYYKRQAYQYIQDQPLEYIRNSWLRLRMTFDRESIGVHWNHEGLVSSMGASVLLPLKVLSSSYWWLLLLSGTAGLLQMVQRGGFKGVLARSHFYGPVLLFALIPVLTVGQDRYHLALNPFLILGAVVFLTALWTRSKAGKSLSSAG